jgi:hypothetical protein
MRTCLGAVAALGAALQETRFVNRAGGPQQGNHAVPRLGHRLINGHPRFRLLLVLGIAHHQRSELRFLRPGRIDLARHVTFMSQSTKEATFHEVSSRVLNAAFGIRFVSHGAVTGDWTGMPGRKASSEELIA